MKKIITFAVAFVAVFAVSIKMYSIDVPVGPNYYCVYFDEVERCHVGDGIACYGIDEDCNWLE